MKTNQAKSLGLTPLYMKLLEHTPKVKLNNHSAQILKK